MPWSWEKNNNNKQPALGSGLKEFTSQLKKQEKSLCFITNHLIGSQATLCAVHDCAVLTWAPQIVWSPNQHPVLHLDTALAGWAGCLGHLPSSVGSAEVLRGHFLRPRLGYHSLPLHSHWTYFQYSLLFFFFLYPRLNHILYSTSVSSTRVWSLQAHPERSHYTMICVPTLP